MFATMACFPNLPGFEYLMEQQEGTHKFSGLPQLLSARQYDDLYVYNGDFGWDNQLGFFGNQGMRNFVGAMTSSTRWSPTRPGASPTRICSTAPPRS